MSQKNDVLGIDVGGVILDFIPHFDTPLSFRDGNYLETPVVKDAIESISKLNASRFSQKIFLVSKHGPDGPGRILEWLRHQDFFSKTGIPETHFYPCAERHEKATIVEKLGITHFVDDRAEVLGHMIGQVPNLYLFQSLDENPDHFKEILPKLHFVQTWEELLKELM